MRTPPLERQDEDHPMVAPAGGLDLPNIPSALKNNDLAYAIIACCLYNSAFGSEPRNRGQFNQHICWCFVVSAVNRNTNTGTESEILRENLVNLGLDIIIVDGYSATS